MSWTSATLIAAIGVSALTWLGFGPKPNSDQVAVIIAPWNDDGVAEVFQTGLPVLDVHLRRHLVVLDTRGNPAAINMLRDKGFWLLDASGSAFCGENAKKGIT